MKVMLNKTKQHDQEKKTFQRRNMRCRLGYPVVVGKYVLTSFKAENDHLQAAVINVETWRVIIRWNSDLWQE